MGRGGAQPVKPPAGCRTGGIALGPSGAAPGAGALPAPGSSGPMSAGETRRGGGSSGALFADGSPVGSGLPPPYCFQKSAMLAYAISSPPPRVYVPSPAGHLADHLVLSRRVLTHRR